MSTELSSLISHLHQYGPYGHLAIPTALEFVIDYKRFVEALEKINDMIGLEIVKRQVAMQIKSFMANYRLYGDPVGEEKLHTLIYGPPGCGKTQLGKYLAELWSSSGCISNIKPGEELFAYTPEKLKDKDNDQILDYETMISELCYELKQNEEKIHELFVEFNELYKEMNKPRKSNITKRKMSSFRCRLSRLNSKWEEPKPPQIKFVVVTRGDLVAKYCGHSARQVREIIKRNIGGVIMIDEAYNLCESDRDDFGKEALTEIVNFMTAWPNKIIFIFSGYRDLIEKTLLKVQPGLARRFNWSFDIEGYTPVELMNIFTKQIQIKHWQIPNDDIAKLELFFKENKDKFPYYGGDTERLCNYIRDVHYQKNWIELLDNRCTKKYLSDMFNTIGYDVIKIAFETFLKNSIFEKAQKDDFSRIQHMYS